MELETLPSCNDCIFVITDENSAIIKLMSVGNNTKCFNYNASMAILCPASDSDFTFILECSVTGANSLTWSFPPFFENVPFFFGRNQSIIYRPPVSLILFVVLEENNGRSQVQVPTANIREVIHGDVVKVDITCETKQSIRQMFSFAVSGELIFL